LRLGLHLLVWRSLSLSCQLLRWLHHWLCRPLLLLLLALLLRQPWLSP
jgi:hypothetical protein